MDKLFELSAEITLDAAGFLRGLVQAEQAARQATDALARMQSAAIHAWSAVAASIHSATERMQAFLTLQSAAPAAPGASYSPYADLPLPAQDSTAVLAQLESVQLRSTSAAPEVDLSGLAEAFSGMTVQMDGKTVGQLVTPTVSREIARQANSKHV